MIDPKPLDETSPFSMGTTAIFNALLELITKKDTVDTVLINIGTILRNCMSNRVVADAIANDKKLNRETAKPAAVLIDSTKKEIAEFSKDVIQMLNENENIINPVVILYFADYTRSITSNCFRVPPPSKKTLVLAENNLRTSAVVKLQARLVGKVTVIELPIMDRTLPYKKLLMEISKIKNRHRVAHITSHPIDYHLLNTCQSWQLIQSFTGKILTKADLPEKVFGNPEVPFTPELHAILGDKEDIKSNLKPGEKSNLISIITKERWKLRSNEWVSNRIRQLNILVPFNIN